MNLKSKFIQSLIVLASAVPATAAVAAPTSQPATAESSASAASLDFASNLPAKLSNVQPPDPQRFGQVWVRSDFVEIQAGVGSGPPVTLSAVEAFDLVNRS